MRHIGVCEIPLINIKPDIYPHEIKILYMGGRKRNKLQAGLPFAGAVGLLCDSPLFSFLFYSNHCSSSRIASSPMPFSSDSLTGFFFSPLPCASLLPASFIFSPIIFFSLLCSPLLCFSLRFFSLLFFSILLLYSPSSLLLFSSSPIFSSPPLPSPPPFSPLPLPTKIHSSLFGSSFVWKRSNILTCDSAGGI